MRVPDLISLPWLWPEFTLLYLLAPNQFGTLSSLLTSCCWQQSESDFAPGWHFGTDFDNTDLGLDQTSSLSSIFQTTSLHCISITSVTQSSTSTSELLLVGQWVKPRGVPQAYLLVEFHGQDLSAGDTSSYAGPTLLESNRLLQK